VKLKSASLIKGGIISGTLKSRLAAVTAFTTSASESLVGAVVSLVSGTVSAFTEARGIAAEKTIAVATQNL